jgi:menaquinone-dependent protoporphyrinogen oxidase
MRAPTPSPARFSPAPAPRALVAFASRDGQTRRIASRAAERLRDAGFAAELIDVGAAASKAVDVGRFAAIVLAAPVRFGKHHAALARWVRPRAAAIARIPSAFISVSLSAGKADDAAQREVWNAIARFEVGARITPHRTLPIAGALLYTRYGFFTRHAMRFICGKFGRDTDMTRDFEYTDWPALDAFAGAFAQSVLRNSMCGMPASSNTSPNATYPSAS